jgi:hypothetical protein
MSILASELIVYGSANMPEANGTTSGGAIDTTCKIVFTDIAATDSIEFVSTNAGDTMNITVYGRSAAGAIVSETKALTGTTPTAATTATFERVLKVVLASTATGTVTVRRATGDTTIATMEPGITSVRRLFYDAAADASGGSSRDFYEKVFVKNTNGSLTLTNAQIAEQADPTGNITFDLEDAVNDNNSVADRLNTAPTGMSSSFNNTTKTVPGGGNLAAGAAIGVWLKLTLAAGTAAAKSTYTIRATGTTT